MQSVNSKTVTTNFLWRLMERCGAQGVSFIVSIFLARLLMPEDYGTIALVTVFISIISVFVDSGFGNALIQKLDADETDFSTVFWFNITMCSIIYALLFFAAPFIAEFYKMPELTPVVRVMSITVLISGVKNIQQAFVSRNMQFKKFFFSTLGGTVFAAFLGIWMAFNGYGVWALITQSLANSIIDTLILWITVKWRPKFLFSFKQLKIMFSFGWKLLASALLNTVFNNLRQLIIGKYYSSSDLAFYNKGKTFPNMIVTNINSSIDSVLLPVMSKEQKSVENMKLMVRRSIRISSFIMWPMMIGFCAVATPVIRLILTDKWLSSVFFMRIFCIVYATQPIQTANLNAINAMGRSDIFLKLEIIKKTLGLLIMLSTVFISVKAMAISFLFTTLVNTVINTWPNKKLLKYSFFEQIKDILPYMLLSGVMFLVCYPISLLPINLFLMLLIQMVAGITVYVGGSFVFKFDSLFYVLNIIKNLISKRRKK